jgi:hypothetical protein
MKTYKLLEHTAPLSVEEIRRLYKGYWVFIVKAAFDEYNGLVSGVPVIIGQMAYDGVEDGIYEVYESDEYGESADLSLLPNRGFISSLRKSG